MEAAVAAGLCEPQGAVSVAAFDCLRLRLLAFFFSLIRRFVSDEEVVTRLSFELELELLASGALDADWRSVASWRLSDRFFRLNDFLGREYISNSR